MTSSAMIWLRRATMADADTIVELIDISSQGGIAEDYRRVYGAGTNWKQQARYDVLRRGSELGFELAVLAMIGKKVAGGMVLNPLLPDANLLNDQDERIKPLGRLMLRVAGSLLIREIAVFPASRGQGVARSMIGLAREHAKATTLKCVSLTVNASNLPALALYETEGFKEVDRVEHLGGTLILMAAQVES